MLSSEFILRFKKKSYFSTINFIPVMIPEFHNPNSEIIFIDGLHNNPNSKK